MKNRTNRLLLAQIRLQLEEKLENDKVFASKKHIYINVDHKKSYYIVDYNGKYLTIFEFHCEYITCDDENRISYYGFHDGYNHNVYINSDKDFFTNFDEAEDFLITSNISKISYKEDFIKKMIRLSTIEPDGDSQKYVNEAIEEYLKSAKELGILERISKIA